MFVRGGCWPPALIVLPRQILAPIVTLQLRVTTSSNLSLLPQTYFIHSCLCLDQGVIVLPRGQKIALLSAKGWTVDGLQVSRYIFVSVYFFQIHLWVVFQTGVLLLSPFPGDQQHQPACSLCRALERQREDLGDTRHWQRTDWAPKPPKTPLLQLKTSGHQNQNQIGKESKEDDDHKNS